MYKALLRVGAKMEPVALKTVKPSDPGATARLLEEAALLTNLVHVSIVHCLGTCRLSGGAEWYLVLELCPLGDLGGAIKLFAGSGGAGGGGAAADPAAQLRQATRLVGVLGGNPAGHSGAALVDWVRGRLSEKLGGALGAGANEAFYRVAVDSAKAVGYVHDQLMRHGDLKPENMLLDGRGRVRLTDFGLARQATGATVVSVVGGGGGAAGIRGTPSYMSPEAFAGKSITVESDVYSLGCLLSVVLTGETPLAALGDNIFAIMKAVVERGERPALPADAPAGLVDLFKGAWNPDPKKRPSAHRAAFVLESLQQGEEVFSGGGGGRRLSLEPVEEGSLRELLAQFSLEGFGEQLKEQGFVGQGDLKDFSIEELEEIGKEIGMKAAHLKPSDSRN